VLIDLRGKRALVTGGSRGIGAATARLLPEAGADVGIGYRSRADDAAAVVRELGSRGVRAFAEAAAVVLALEGAGVRAFAAAGDLSEPAGAEALFARAEREFGGVDIFVGNAGVWPADEAPVAEMDDARWRRTMRENVDAIFYASRLAARALGRGGRIVLVSSTAGQRGEALHADYAASKGAVISFVKSLAVELAPADVTVNCVAPGWVDTEMVADPFAGEGRARIERAIPLGRVASPADVAGPIVFLCSALARHVTGEVLNVNGGSVLCG
jgi:3-oxoacyl-[acyl-carrier protein] reductase